jgi:hypothetical protein
MQRLGSMYTLVDPLVTSIAIILVASYRAERSRSLDQQPAWCGRRDSNPHEGCPSAVFKTAASAIPPRPRCQDA